jgi:hypothetical protein
MEDIGQTTVLFFTSYIGQTDYDQLATPSLEEEALLADVHGE